MTLYRAPTNVSQIAGDIREPADIDALVAGMHPTMQAEGRRLLEARDAAARMMSGTNSNGVWLTPGMPYDPGQIDIRAEAIVSACAVTDMAPYPRAAVLEHLTAMASIDAGHPMVVERELLRKACTGMDEAAPDWSALDADIASRATLAAGPSIGQACTFFAADGSVRDGGVTYVWGPEMVNLTFTDVTGLAATATSVPVLRQPDPARTYYCVLR